MGKNIPKLIKNTMLQTQEMQQTPSIKKKKFFTLVHSKIAEGQKEKL